MQCGCNTALLCSVASVWRRATKKRKRAKWLHSLCPPDNDSTRRTVTKEEKKKILYEMAEMHTRWWCNVRWGNAPRWRNSKLKVQMPFLNFSVGTFPRGSNWPLHYKARFYWWADDNAFANCFAPKRNGEGKTVSKSCTTLRSIAERTFRNERRSVVV